MVENFVFSYKGKNVKIEDSIFDYSELEEKFISTYGLKEEIKTQIKFYINGKEITKDDDLMDIIKNDDIVEIKNINEEDKGDERQKKEEIEKKDEIQKENEAEKQETNKNDSNENKVQGNLDSILFEKFEENNNKIEKTLMEKINEKIEQSNSQISNMLEEKIKNFFSENDINKKMIDIDDKINKLNQDYIDFKSVKIKYFNKFIEFIDNKSSPQDSLKVEQSEPIQSNKEIDDLKEKNNKLKDIIKKLKNKMDKEFTNKEIPINISSQLENLKKENEKLKEENKNLNNKVKNLESELNKKQDKIDLKTSSSFTNPKIPIKKYNCKLNPDKKSNIFPYEEIKENESISIKLVIKNEGDEQLPKNSEFQLMNEINGLTLEKYKTKDAIKDTEEVILKFKVDLESIKLNEDIDVKLKLIDDQKKDIDMAKCKIKIKIEKGEEQEIVNDEDANKNVNNNLLEENDYEALYNEINEMCSIENVGENMNTFKEKLLALLETKKEKYSSISEKTDFIESLKEDLMEIFMS